MGYIFFFLTCMELQGGHFFLHISMVYKFDSISKHSSSSAIFPSMFLLKIEKGFDLVSK